MWADVQFQAGDGLELSGSSYTRFSRWFHQCIMTSSSLTFLFYCFSFIQKFYQMLCILFALSCNLNVWCLGVSQLALSFLKILEFTLKAENVEVVFAYLTSVVSLLTLPSCFPESSTIEPTLHTTKNSKAWELFNQNETEERDNGVVFIVVKAFNMWVVHVAQCQHSVYVNTEPQCAAWSSAE